jgi:hypothetical protein
MIFGTHITVGTEAQGHVSLFRSTGGDQLMNWSGVDYSHGVEQGWGHGNDVGMHIMYLHLLGYVDLQIAASAHLRVCDAAGAQLRSAGYLTFMY